jgi:beta-lactamase superfamily II metal-dependent hydrolase
MGDAVETELKKLIYSGKNLTCDVLKLPHHGVYDENLPALLTVTMPEIVIICDSTKNPADEDTLKALDFFDTTVLRTKDGDVHLIAAENVLKIADD